MEQWFAPVNPSTLPDVSRVLVVAPHPDDEVFGCGGLLALYRKAGAMIQVQILTDGAGYHQLPDREAIYKTRMAESNKALETLGVAPADFSGFADRSLVARPDLSRLIRSRIISHQSELVLVPSLWEVHPDHLAAARAALDAVAELVRAGENAPILMFYEIGAPQRVDFFLDITSVWSLKLQAMQVFVSQNSMQDYPRLIEALNAYRTYTLPSTVRYAEGYALVSPQMIANIMACGGDLPVQILDRWKESALSAATACVEQLQMNVAATQRSIGELQQHAAFLEQQVAAMGLEIGWLQRERKEILESTSWRITAPLRRLRGFLRSKIRN
ncbi:PIG-L deacetylase family protein [Alicycliphilus denitrificans]|uniref:PIG-L deacetylase family protein n=1 Tax=Alicycliphilus denitrificans TaxID=179636 RepID=UPI00384F1811